MKCWIWSLELLIPFVLNCRMLRVLCGGFVVLWMAVGRMVCVFVGAWEGVGWVCVAGAGLTVGVVHGSQDHFRVYVLCVICVHF